MRIDPQLSEKKQGIKLLNMRQKWLGKMDDGCSGHTTYLKVKSALNILFIEEITLDTIIDLLSESSCTINFPTQGGCERCGKFKGKCKPCIKAFLDGETSGTDIEGLKKYHGDTK